MSDNNPIDKDDAPDFIGGAAGLIGLALMVYGGSEKSAAIALGGAALAVAGAVLMQNDKARKATRKALGKRDDADAPKAQNAPKVQDKSPPRGRPSKRSA